MDPVEEYIGRKLQERKENGNLRTLKTERAQVDFFSNDYLGLARSGRLETQSGSGSTGSRLLSGNSEEAEKLERRIAAFHGAEAALLFNSGYDANVGLLSSIADRHTTILYDELCHASIIDGIRLSAAGRYYKFGHNDVAELERKLQQFPSERVIIVVESVYSMDGNRGDIGGIVEVTRRYRSSLVVDEAHATGVVGARGKGLVSELGLEKEVFARVHTFGKALGCHGATVLGSEQLKQYLINFARPFIYTTALAPHSIAAISKAYDYLESKEFSNNELHELIAYFRVKVAGIEKGKWLESDSPIQVLVLGSNERAKAAAAALQAGGLQVSPILHPTVPKGSERLRMCIHSFNTKEQIDMLFEILSTVQ